MPVLKDLTCAIELPGHQQTLQEFGTIYGDGCVETFVPVPDKPLPFSIHLTSDKFIAPGIAMYVFVDGVYQCNRNRQDLKLRKSSESRSLVDFKVRQKEEKQKDGSMIAREWTFEKLNCVQADGAPEKCSSNILDNIGCIEVVVLRCTGARNAKSVSQMNLDGANDDPSLEHYFGLDGQPRATEVTSAYDDRTFEGYVNGYGPPPPVPFYRSPYVESVQSHDDVKSRSHRRKQTTGAPSLQPSIIPRSQPHSRYSEPVSPRSRPSNSTLPPAFQYGSGPIPPTNALFPEPPQNTAVMKTSGADPRWLDELLTRAVKQGIAESRRHEPLAVKNSGSEQRVLNAETRSQLPGAWPTSPITKVPQPYQLSEPAVHDIRNHDPGYSAPWGQPPRNGNEHQISGRKDTHVTWDKEPAWESESNANGWTSVEDTPDESWDTEETWATTKPSNPSESSFEGRSTTFATRGYFGSRAVSPLSEIRNRRRSTEGRSRRSRSKSRSRSSKRLYDLKSSSEDNEGWTHINATSSLTSSMDSSDDTPKRPHSRSRARTLNSQAGRQTHHSGSVRKEHYRKVSQPTYQAPVWQTTQLRSTHGEHAPSIITPTVMNGPIVTTVPALVHSMMPFDVHSKKASILTEPTVPPPAWGCAAPDTARKSSQPASSVAPAPFANSLKNFVHNMFTGNAGDTRSISSSSWGSGKKGNGAQGSWEDNADKTNGWNEPGDGSWGHTAAAEPDKSGWDKMSNKAEQSWNTTNNVTDPQPTGWAANNNDWTVEDTSKQQKSDVGVGDSWEVKKDEWTNQGGGWNTAKEADNSKQNLDDSWNTAKDVDDPWTNEGEAWNKFDSNDKDTVPWGADNGWNLSPFPMETSKPASAKDDNKAASTSKRHSDKSLTKHRQHRSASADFAPKPHWQFPPLPANKQLPAISEDHKTSKSRYIAPKEPLYKISQETAKEKGVEHQVRAGKGMQYGHAVGRPEYLDSLEAPYAVFRFKYRSRAMLKSMFDDAVPSHGALTLPTPNSALAQAKEKLKTLPQDQLIEKMLRLQTKLGAQEQARKVSHSSSKEHKERRHEHKHDRRSERRPSVSEQTEVVARNLTENWVKQQSRDPSEKGREKEKTKSKALSVGKEKEAMQTWGQTGGEGEAYPNAVW